MNDINRIFELADLLCNNNGDSKINQQRKIELIELANTKFDLKLSKKVDIKIICDLLKSELSKYINSLPDLPEEDEEDEEDFQDSYFENKDKSLTTSEKNSTKLRISQDHSRDFSGHIVNQNRYCSSYDKTNKKVDDPLFIRDEIDPRFIIRIVTLDKLHKPMYQCYDVRDLHDWISKNNKTDPLTRGLFNEEESKKIEAKYDAIIHLIEETVVHENVEIQNEEDIENLNRLRRETLERQQNQQRQNPDPDLQELQLQENRIYIYIQRYIAGIIDLDRLRVIIMTLISQGADIHESNDFALITASTTPSNLNLEGIVTYLLERGANVHAQNDSAILGASRLGNVPVMQSLLNHGADVHAINDLSLRNAIEGHHVDAVILLLSSGADINTVPRYTIRNETDQQMKNILSRHYNALENFTRRLQIGRAHV